KFAVAHIFGIWNRVAVIGHSQLHKHIPSTTETNTANGSTVQRQNIFQTINRLILKGISVGINLKFSVAFNIYKFRSAEQTMIRDVLVFSFLNKFCGATLSGQYHVSGIPRKFIIPKIVVAFGSNQAAAKRFKKKHFSAF